MTKNYHHSNELAIGDLVKIREYKSHTVKNILVGVIVEILTKDCSPLNRSLYSIMVNGEILRGIRGDYLEPVE